MEQSIPLNGLKHTRQRMKIAEILYQAEAPLTAEEILASARKDYPAMALTTVYRNLEAMEQKRVVNKMMYNDGIARFEYVNKRHTHRHFLVCMGCNLTIPLDDCPISAIEKTVYEKDGFTVTGHNLEIYGYCKHCLEKQKGR